MRNFHNPSVGPASSEATGTHVRLRAILGGSAGNLVEWYDWYVYAAFTLYFAAVFFPKGNQTAQLLQAAGVFAVGFAARPVGAWVMGLYADRAGRKAALTASVAMMCFGSLIIAATPGAASIGVAAPVILLLARILQGLSVGGEYGASATYLSEMAGRGSRGFWSSFQSATMIAGQLTALLVLILLQRFLNKEQMLAWGWRIPFVIGAVLAILMFWLRTKMDETPEFKQASAAGAPRARAWVLLAEHPRQSLTILGLTAAGSLSFYIYTTYMQKFLVNTAGFSKNQATEVSAAALICFMVMQPLFGWLSDKYGRKPMLVLAYGGGALTLAPIMSLLAHAASVWVAFGLILAGMVFLSAYTAVGAIVKAELFPTHIRSLGVALPYAIANAAFGGTAEYVALWFKSSGAESGFYLYATICLAVGLAVALAMKETRREKLDDYSRPMPPVAAQRSADGSASL